MLVWPGLKSSKIAPDLALQKVKSRSYYRRTARYGQHLKSQEVAGLLYLSQNLSPSISVLEEGAHQHLGFIWGEFLSQGTLALGPPVLNVLQTCPKDTYEFRELSPQPDMSQHLPWTWVLLSLHLKSARGWLSMSVHYVHYQWTVKMKGLLLSIIILLDR